MKKILLVLLFVVLLSACKPEDTVEYLDDFSFDGKTYVYSDTTSKGFDQYVADGHLIEINCEETCLMSFEIGEDIYLIQGTSEAYDISKNGTIILIDGKDQTPTGMENPEWNEDILPIIEGYKK